MSVAFDHRDAGTSEAAWATADFGAAELALDARHLIVLAAHPDDETLGAGGLIAVAATAGIDVSVVVATDGEAADPARAGLALLRRQELVAALHRLAPSARIRFLGLPDGELRESVAPLRAALADELTRVDPTDTLVATTWWGDGHRDHRVLGEAALAVAAGARVVGFPIWYWHWGDPGLPEPGPWLALRLPAGARAAKAEAIAAHRSQLGGGADVRSVDGPLLHEGMLAHFQRPIELFVEARSVPSPSVPAAEFDAFFRRHDDPWGFESRWYERRKRALMLASLPRERFTRGLELGCATGVLTAQLAERCDDLIAVDSSAEALGRARDRVPGVRFEQRVLPGDWPDGTFDLIVFSELGYYWSARDLDLAVDRIVAALSAAGVLAACHWRRPIAAAPSTGDQVHRALARSGLFRLVQHVEDDVRLEIWTRPGTGTVAQQEGLA